MKKQEILKIAQSNAERISEIEKHLAMSKPKPQIKGLGVGKWYRLRNGNLIYATALMANNHISGYGFGGGGEAWTDGYDHWLVDGEFTEATPQEVEQALIEEAKRRYKVGDRISDANGVEITPNGSYVFKKGILYYGGAVIFLKGNWATPIVDKFAELKEAHKNGAVIQLKHHTDGWVDLKDPKFNDTFSLYRIKPLEEEKPMTDNIQNPLLTEIMVLRETNDKLSDLLQKICIARRNGQEIPLMEIENLIKSVTV
ncbi:hypothetical protein G5B30_16660 [Sphingobacterium sp. SGG-5]|uniref:hypothetical protein n=1 Tax=Sphingobacterium sp. SGG-5 TaxID=2710881 RepID=UPI0013EA4BE7|nr:hypothetical protein [Sphingobacterium sp. SGG-5]NGM63543.1 hypothetical protein [Sphingobacterium sp. SGG-5]